MLFVLYKLVEAIVEAFRPKTQHIYVKRSKSNLYGNTYVPFFAGLKSHPNPLLSELNKKKEESWQFLERTQSVKT